MTYIILKKMTKDFFCQLWQFIANRFKTSGNTHISSLGLIAFLFFPTTSHAFSVGDDVYLWGHYYDEYEYKNSVCSIIGIDNGNYNLRCSRESIEKSTDSGCVDLNLSDDQMKNMAEAVNPVYREAFGLIEGDKLLITRLTNPGNFDVDYIEQIIYEHIRFESLVIDSIQSNWWSVSAVKDKTHQCWHKFESNDNWKMGIALEIEPEVGLEAGKVISHLGPSHQILEPSYTNHKEIKPVILIDERPLRIFHELSWVSSTTSTNDPSEWLNTPLIFLSQDFYSVEKSGSNFWASISNLFYFTSDTLTLHASQGKFDATHYHRPLDLSTPSLEDLGPNWSSVSTLTWPGDSVTPIPGKLKVMWSGRRICDSEFDSRCIPIENYLWPRELEYKFVYSSYSQDNIDDGDESISQIFLHQDQSSYINLKVGDGVTEDGMVSDDPASFTVSAIIDTDYMYAKLQDISCPFIETVGTRRCAAWVRLNRFIVDNRFFIHHNLLAPGINGKLFSVGIVSNSRTKDPEGAYLFFSCRLFSQNVFSDPWVVDKCLAVQSDPDQIFALPLSRILN
jgi:hypothetical protein